MQRSSQAYQSGAEVFQSRGYSASDIFSNVEDVTANKIHRDLTPPTMHAQAQIQAKFSQFIAVLKEQNRTEFDQYNLVHAFDAGADLLPLRKIFRILHTILKLNGTAAVIIAFLNYICLSSRGSIDERITVVTLQNKIGLFLGLTTGLTGNSYVPAITQQLYAYADGKARRTFDLSVDVRIKSVADQVDVSRILTQLWTPSHSTKCTRIVVVECSILAPTQG
ncbi:hypothetical protein B0H13DRAFT_1906523 [Mycena leptocephala]|nr:hypothetical protein B0H13DRAFT_1906523 [Mycena leptocephala]